MLRYKDLHEDAMHKIFPLILLDVFIITIATTTSALAYVDPGSGSLMVQVIIAGFVGVLFYFRNVISSLAKIFHRKKDDHQKRPHE